ncbi:MAG: hypothetical protein AAB665_01075 [Patescibacteria group bacterium]
MSEMKMKQGGPQGTKDGENEGPPPYFEGDKAWSKEREAKWNAMFTELGGDRWADKEHDKETLGDLRTLIEETVAAIKDNPDTVAGKTLIEQSKLLQMMVWHWYQATTEQRGAERARLGLDKGQES